MNSNVPGILATTTDLPFQERNVLGITTQIDTVPAKLTASDLPYHEVTSSYTRVADPTQVSQVDNSSQGSIAIEENPLRELKAMKRQIGRLATKIMELEDENERRQTRELGIWTLLSGTMGVVLFLLFRFRR